MAQIIPGSLFQISKYFKKSEFNFSRFYCMHYLLETCFVCDRLSLRLRSSSYKELSWRNRERKY